MPSFNTFCDPSAGQSLRSDFVSGNNVGAITGNCAAILGGVPLSTPNNNNAGDLSVIVMGQCNNINTFGSPASNGCYNFLGNGFCNTVAGNYNFLGSGSQNAISSTISHPVTNSFLGAGAQNCICDNGTVAVANAFLGAGFQNLITGVNAVLVGGSRNCVLGAGSFIGGGENNVTNTLVSDSVIVGGALNRIDSTTYVSVNNVIVGGYNNTICDNSSDAGIMGGFQNIVSSDFYGFVGGGANNTASGRAGAVAGGGNNNAGGLYSFVGGGGGNLAACGNAANGDCSFIGGGVANATQNGSAYGAIGGGQQNTVCSFTNHSAVFGGYNNCVLGNCSAILGGEGNNDGGFNYVGIYGCNVAGVMAQAFHVNELVIQNIPVGGVGPVPPVGAATGSLWYYPDGSGNNVVYVK